MESRTMLLQGEVNEEKAGEIISGFLALADLKPPKGELKEGEMPYDPITMYVSTYGGSADEMFAIFDIMNHCKNHVILRQLGSEKSCQQEPLYLLPEQKENAKFLETVALCYIKYQREHSDLCLI